MPSNLDLDAIKRDYEANDWIAVMAVLPTVLIEVERLRQESADVEAVCMSQEGQIARLMAELATAKRIGAAECAEVLERHAAQYTSDDETSVALSGMLIKIAAELRAEVGPATSSATQSKNPKD